MWLGKTSTIREYEKQFWANSLVVLPDGSPVFIAPIDTTFALYNKKFFIPQDSFDRALRLAGNYSSLHIPWLNNDLLPSEERKFYALRNMAGAYHELDGLHLRLFSDYQDILSSFSWKITKPVRFLARYTRSLVQLFKSVIKWKSWSHPGVQTYWSVLFRHCFNELLNAINWCEFPPWKS